MELNWIDELMNVDDDDKGEQIYDEYIRQDNRYRQIILIID